MLRLAITYVGHDPVAAWSDELPNTGVELVIETAGAWDLDIDGHRTRAGAFVAGLVAGRVRTRSSGPVRLVQVTIDPFDVPALFGVPAGELARTATDLNAVLGRDGGELLERIGGAGGWAAGGDPDRPSGADGDPARLADAWVRHGAARPVRDSLVVPADVRRAVALIRAGQGARRVESIAHELGCSRRHLARRFAQWVGLSPSAYARLTRFELATDALARDPSRPLADVAFASGYADHAHMDRDFRTFAGHTPSAVATRFRTPA